LGFFLIADSSFAAEKYFSTIYDVSYEVQESGNTVVTQNVSLTNLTRNYYASEYDLSIGTAKVEKIRASDSLGQIKITTEKLETSTKIHVEFNDKVIGQGKTLRWVLKYEREEIASKNGRILEVFIPRLGEAKDIDEYRISLKVPPSFGKPSYAKPALKDGKLLWTKTELEGSGINVVFGQYQLFDFKLSYHLFNPGFFPVTTEIALPPDTAYQKIFLSEIKPTPENIYIDEDGNWLAKYRLKAGQRMDAEVSGTAKLDFRPKLNIPVDEEKFFKQYLKPQKYWEADDPEIIKKAKELKNPQAIYQYITGFLKYDYERVGGEEIERLGAVEAFKNPQNAICMEFTDLFIALCRAAGIPARELDGYAFTTNARLRPLSLKRDILHAWPEYYDKERKTWIMVDPTWGTTTDGMDYFSVFDFNHFTFSIKGIDSEKPYPAGSYKFVDSDSKDVEVTLHEGEFNEKPTSLKLSLIVPPTPVSGTSVKAILGLVNESEVFYPGGELIFSAGKLSFLSPEKINSGGLPPRGKKTIEITIKPISFFASAKDTLYASLSGQTISAGISLRPYILLRLLPFIIGGLTIFAIAIIVLKRRKKNSADEQIISPVPVPPRRDGYGLPAGEAGVSDL
ncbi:MAG: transglutaminase domain-containing protein, partial [bacterium]|nr:transglutaminase domain-containing protein [bacterium]